MPDKTIKCRECKQDFTFTEGEQDFYAQRDFSEPKRCKPCRDARKAKRQNKTDGRNDSDTEPDWQTPCENCGQVPTLPMTGMCGPCTFGEAETVGGNW
jgi:hypothetical protein